MIIFKIKILPVSMSLKVSMTPYTYILKTLTYIGSTKVYYFALITNNKKIKKESF